MTPADIRVHLLSLVGAFTDIRTPHPHPDPGACAGDEHPDAWERLIHGWNRCLATSDVIDARYRADWSGDGPLAILAEPVRNTALVGLRDIWAQLVERYLLAGAEDDPELIARLDQAMASPTVRVRLEDNGACD